VQPFSSFLAALFVSAVFHVVFSFGCLPHVSMARASPQASWPIGAGDATHVLPCFKAFPVDYAAFMAMNEYQLWNALARWYGQKPCKKAMAVDCLGTLRQ